MMADKNKKKKNQCFNHSECPFLCPVSHLYYCPVIPRHILPIPVAYYGMLVSLRNNDLFPNFADISSKSLSFKVL